MSHVRVGVACFVWREGKFLILKRIGAHGSGTWSVPGGHLEYGESWEKTAAREVQEETGMRIEQVSFLAATNDNLPAEGKHYATIWMTAEWAGNEPSITEPEKCAEQLWCDFTTLPAPLFEPFWSNLRQVKPELFR